MKIPDHIADEIFHKRQQWEKLKKEASELTHVKLAKKFECSTHSIVRIAKGGSRPRTISADDCRLLRACIEEKKRLDAELEKLSMENIAKEYGVTMMTICRIAWGHRIAAYDGGLA